MDEARRAAVKHFELYRRDKGRTEISRTLHHDPISGRSWLTQVHEKTSARGETHRVETTVELADMGPDERAVYELRLRNELAAEAAALPVV